MGNQAYIGQSLMWLSDLYGPYKNDDIKSIETGTKALNLAIKIGSTKTLGG